MKENSVNVSAAFSKQAPVFDQQSNENKLSEYFRSVYREELIVQLKPNSKILELNCGTGIDALYLAHLGHTVLATDNAPGMLETMEDKIEKENLNDRVKTRRCSFHDISTIQDGPFDHIVSNFGGLNCTNNLKDVLSQLAPLLKKDGKVTLVIMPKISPWEILMLFKGDFKTAFRRFRKNTPAHIEGVHFYCYYYNPNYVMNTLKKEFKLVTLKGIFITVPPEFYKDFVERYPKLFSFLSKVDRLISGFFPFTYCCDHYLITLQKKI